MHEQPSSRLTTLDTIRGFSLLGILPMNVVALGLPSAVYTNPMATGVAAMCGEFTGIDRIAWVITHTLFDLKMMSIFAMLFGAGIALQTGAWAGGREVPVEGGTAKRHYLRMFWLFCFGVFHAFAMWYGDILLVYSICGMVVYPLRRFKARTLILLAIPLLLIPMLVQAAMGGGLWWLQNASNDMQELIDSGAQLSEEQTELFNSWNETSSSMNPSAQVVSENIAKMQGGLVSAFKANLGEAAFLQALFLGLYSWRIGGLMLIGMALIKSGLLHGRWSSRSLWTMAAIGLGIGLPLIGVGIIRLLQNRFDAPMLFMVDGQFNYVASVAMALAYISLLSLTLRASMFPWLTQRLEAVGRMSFTNYIMHTVLGIVFFRVFGLFGELWLAQLWLFTLPVWGLQLMLSPWWLSKFQMGPLEWLWRSLSRLKVQPLRKPQPRIS